MASDRGADTADSIARVDEPDSDNHADRTKRRDPPDRAVCLAVCVGWRMAELYDSKELPGPPQRRSPGELPAHLPGLGEMSGHEKACALTAHVGADLAALGRELGLERVMPTVQPVLAALAVPRHGRDEVRAAVLDLYLTVRDLIAGSNPAAAAGFGLGRLLADTVLLPAAGASAVLAERFEEYRLANAVGWLDDLDTRLPPRSAAVVRATLGEWQQWVARLPRTSPGTIDPASIDPAHIDAAVIRALHQQGAIWRRLLTGEQRPDQLLDRQAYLGAAARLLGAAWSLGLHYLWKWAWVVLLVAGVAGAAVWAALAYAPSGTSRAATLVVSAAGFLGISWLSVRATLGRALRQAENALWEAEVSAAIAKAATLTPRNRKTARPSA
jgi:hypothetical protein